MKLIVHPQENDRFLVKPSLGGDGTLCTLRLPIAKEVGGGEWWTVHIDGHPSTSYSQEDVVQFFLNGTWLFIPRPGDVTLP